MFVYHSTVRESSTQAILSKTTLRPMWMTQPNGGEYGPIGPQRLYAWVIMDDEDIIDPATRWTRVWTP